MITQIERKKIYTQKREKIESKKDKKGNIKTKIIAGFNKATFEQFEEWFNEEEFAKGCHYCGTTNEKSFELYKLQRNGLRHDATRGGKRGKRLELDRMNPDLSYDNLQNIVWCCYWCNNAKSNFFTKEEFKQIAIEIGKTLNNIH